MPIQLSVVILTKQKHKLITKKNEKNITIIKKLYLPAKKPKAYKP